MEYKIEKISMNARNKALTRYRLEFISENFDNKSNGEIAKHLKVSKAYVFYLYKQLGLSRKYQKQKRLIKIVKANEGKTVTEIAKIAGVSYNTIYRLIPIIKDNNLSKRKNYPCSRFDDLFKRYNCNSVFELREKIGHRNFEQEIINLNK